MRSLFLTTILALTALPLSAQNFSFFGTYWETEQGKSYEAVGLGIPASDMQKAFERACRCWGKGTISRRMGQIIHPPIPPGGAQPCASNSNSSCAMLMAMKRP